MIISRRVLARVRNVIYLAAFITALMAFFTVGQAFADDFPTNGTFTGSSGWSNSQSTSGLCYNIITPLCSISNSYQGSAGNPGGAIRVKYTALANVLGLFSGSGTWTSTPFTYTGPDNPTGAYFSVDRKVTASALLALGGTVNFSVSLQDLSAGGSLSLAGFSAGSSDSGFVHMSSPVSQSFMLSGHSYQLQIVSAFTSLVGVATSGQIDTDNLLLCVDGDGTSGCANQIDSAPVNVTPPTVTGTIEVGKTLTCNTGTWTGVPAPTFTYAWYDDTNTVISGATSQTYVVQTSDETHTLSCKVTATNTVGSAAVQSGETIPVPVPGVGPTNLTKPTITGTTEVGNTLTCNVGTWDATPPPTYTYQWIRDGIDIANETNATYNLTSADLNANISCRVTATNQTGSADATSDPVGPITMPACPSACEELPEVPHHWLLLIALVLLGSLGYAHRRQRK